MTSNNSSDGVFLETLPDRPLSFDEMVELDQSGTMRTAAIAGYPTDEVITHALIRTESSVHIVGWHYQRQEWERLISEFEEWDGPRFTEITNRHTDEKLLDVEDYFDEETGADGDEFFDAVLAYVRDYIVATYPDSNLPLLLPLGDPDGNPLER